MKQRYTISKNDEKTGIIIKEFAELDKEIFSLLCEETYENEIVKAAVANGKDALIQTLRTQNLFPIGIYSEAIAEAVIKMYEAGDDQPVELTFDDLDLMLKESEVPLVIDDIDEEEVEIDDLLDEDLPDDDYDEKSDIKNLPYSLKISDDDPADLDEDD
ncbi:MAG: hypothetical protein WB792_00505 [Desulfobacterales bacterium]